MSGPRLHCDERGKKSERELMETLIKRREGAHGPLDQRDDLQSDLQKIVP